MKKDNKMFWFVLIITLLIIPFGYYYLTKNGKQNTQDDMYTVINSKNLAENKAITDIQWILKSLVVDGKEFEVSETNAPFISIKQDGSVNGVAVNNFFGNLNLDEKGNIDLSGLASTKKMGPPELQKQEDMLFQAFAKVIGMKVSSSKLNLVFFDKSGKNEIIFYVPIQ